MIAPLPYADLVGSRDTLALLASTPGRIAGLVQGWDARRWSRTYAPGKWTAAQVVLHLAHDEIGWGKRVRLALADDHYVVQPYDGARWVDAEPATDPHAALEAFLALRRLNLKLFAGIPTERRARPFRHPEMGEISIDWILQTLAGHDLHHLRHLEAIAAT
ncbi:MAG TPA: DinB family protein [Candidatus Eisenbacteria bacterium]|jgi:hypothetical protein